MMMTCVTEYGFFPCHSVFRHGVKMSLPAFLVSVVVLINGICCAPSNSVVTKWQNYPNDRPILGVLAQERRTNTTSDEAGKSYIAASYVKFIEAGGARVVPIHNNESTDYLTDLLDQLNGVLLPGGGVSLDPTKSFYARDGKLIFEYAKQANDKGDYFPLWGTCLGFEFLATLFVDNTSILVNCSAEDIALPLNISNGALNGRLFSQLPTDVYQALLNEAVTANYHSMCLTPQAVISSGLDKHINVLSTNFDANGLEFVSTFEAKKYPFYAVQWHPEKNPWEWSMNNSNIPHTPDAIRVAQYFASFFVNEGRKNVHKFKKPSREESELIYAMNPLYTGKAGSDFAQMYEFSIKNGPKKMKKKPAEVILAPVIQQVQDYRAEPAAASSGLRTEGSGLLISALVGLIFFAVR